MKHKNSSGQIYAPGIPIRLFVLGMGIFLALMHVIMLQSLDLTSITNEPFVAFMLAFILLIDSWFLWYGIIFTTQTRIIANADGIELQRGGASLFAAWENISHFGVKGAGKNQQSGIYLYHKIEPNVNGLAERLFFGHATDFLPLGAVIALPVHWGFFKRKINFEKLAQTDFGQDVALYAPHLLNEYGEKSKDLSHRLRAGTRQATYVVGSDAQKLQKYN